MEKTKKTTKAPAKKTVAKKPVSVKEKAPKVVKQEEVKVAEVKQEKVQPAEVKEQTTAKVKLTLNQELNLLIGLFSLMTIIAFCFAFQGGSVEVLGWELVLKADMYSGVFKGLMILYVITLFIDCILAVRIESENEIFNVVEKALYMFTLVMNFVVIAVLLSIITKIGIGLIIFFILSIISVIVKAARIFAKK